MAQSTNSDLCPSCTTRIPAEAQFCPSCGTRLATDETLEMNAGPVVPESSHRARRALGESRSAIHVSHRQPFGIHPVPLLGALGGGALFVAVILLASGSLAAGLVILAIALVCLVLFSGGIRREPEAPGASPALRATTRVRALAGLAAVTARACARAGLDLMRIHRRRALLRTQLKANLAPLGEAVHRDDQTRAHALKQHAAELEQELGQTERDAAAVVDAARRQIELERTAGEPTEVFTKS